MHTTEKITDFSLEETPSGKAVTISALIKALNAHCKTLLKGESFCDSTVWEQGREGARIPKRFRSLISFTIEGDSEGWYVHAGAMVSFGNHPKRGVYVDFGFAKLWSAEDAYAVGLEAQKFLTAARWN